MKKIMATLLIAATITACGGGNSSHVVVDSLPDDTNIIPEARLKAGSGNDSLQVKDSLAGS
ncbi:MAG: hypothetical protein KIT80_12680 [Chitinophagaceae bacterium]|nr:hypothetical protein [Chitinophagaceae bacterium]MCW5927760.1 hypothetical protein [Chitinophagaceae bacterium]